MMLPALTSWDTASKWDDSKRRLLFIAEGFEERATSWLQQLTPTQHFENAIIFKYVPEKKSRLQDLLNELSSRSRNDPICVDFFRFDPSQRYPCWEPRLGRVSAGS